ncbi:cation diffusion facilitator family transporter [Leifsonia shinshuensis]|uniref:Cation diffusion facilitator family transporter n=1 Tax=Leifsonia shinshuensis TaxID=150026 RepID=A0A7G6Y779_9MICO|nr:cation diffusion facilitator family transporter [Leifsonia shinshuensis]QNE34344.1 cation diffusion facilitator family transporter [Leifsonia shinshuensis]
MANPKRSGQSLLTVLLALGANIVVALAKTVAAVLTGSASMVAESAHSWADAGNEIFLLQAERRALRPQDELHPTGYGREAYVWSLFAAVGLFTAGAVVSILHGFSQLGTGEPDSDYLVNYIVLAVAFVFEGISFFQSFRQARSMAAERDTGTLEHVLSTSNPTLRAVFAEDAAALIGLVIAFLGVLLHELTGNAVYDAVGSILVGILLAVVAVVLIDRNRRFLLGEPAPDRVNQAALVALLQHPQVERVTYLHLEYVGPERVFLVAAVDLIGDDKESDVADDLYEVERAIERDEHVAEAVLTLSRRGAPALLPHDPDALEQR